MKKKVKKQLKTDEFANFMSRMFDFFRSNQREFMIAGAAVLFIALVFLSVRYVQAVNSRKQSEILGRILQLESEVKDTPDKLVELEHVDSISHKTVGEILKKTNLSLTSKDNGASVS